MSSDKKIVCIGGANLDRKVQSLAPLQLGTSNPAHSSQTFGGVARNVAENLARLGAKTSLLTALGTDTDGDLLLEHCRKCGIDVINTLRLKNYRTGNYTANLDVNGDLAVAMADMAIYDTYSPMRLAQHWPAPDESTTVVLDTNFPADTLKSIIVKCNESHAALCVVPVSVPKIKRLPFNLQGIDVLIANVDEALALSEMPLSTADRATDRATDATADRTADATADMSADILEACRRIQERGCRNVIVTRGSAGVVFLDERGDSELMTVPPCRVVDVTGAGDAFASGVIMARHTYSAPLREAVQLGIVVAQRTLQTRETVSQQLTPAIVKTWHLEDMEGLEGDNKR